MIPAAAGPTTAEGSAAPDAVVTEPERLTRVFQPIVDLRRAAVAGYEAPARFAGPPSATPDLWFRAAAAQGAPDGRRAAPRGRAGRD